MEEEEDQEDQEDQQEEEPEPPDEQVCMCIYLFTASPLTYRPSPPAPLTPHPSSLISDSGRAGGRSATDPRGVHV